MKQSLYVPRALWLRLYLAAFLNITLWVVLMGFAMLWLSASEAVIIAYLMPVITTFLAWPLLGERITPLRVIALLDRLRKPRRIDGRQRHRGVVGEIAGRRDGADHRRLPIRSAPSC